MKIYVSCDMEGTAGVCSWEQVDARNYTPEYSIYRRYMTGEVRAAIEGARAAGASEVLVNDSHGPMRNLLFDQLPDDLRVIFGNRKPYSMVQGLDRTFAGVFFTGYHAAIGTADATLCHTYTPSVVYGVRVNGVRCSEATLNAALAGYHGVPVLLVTGDAATIAEVREQMPWVTGVVVKESVGNYAADSLSPQAAQEAIRAGAAGAVRNSAAARPFVFEAPIALEIDLARVEQADHIEVIPSFERTGSRSVRFVHDDYRTVFKAFVAAFRMGALADEPA
ncbi:MAG: M55 family metallopeptidase [Vulcanimicrobiaceae bacterium]